jgi:hypothetical protein
VVACGARPAAEPEGASAMEGRHQALCIGSVWLPLALGWVSFFLENQLFISYIMIVYIDHLTRTPLEELKIIATPL